MALGCFYDYGLGVTKNPRLATRYYREAAEKGDGGAQFNLAVSLEFGSGTRRDLAEARKWYAAAARKGVKEARGQAARLSRTKLKSED
jgi:TPR repeat protein